MHSEEIAKANESFERYKERLANFSNEFELGLFIFLARKTFWWAVLFFVFAFSVGYLYLRYTLPIYQSNSIIQINRQNTANSILNVAEFQNSENSISVDIEFIRSKEFLKRVVKKMPLDVTYYSEGQFLTTLNYPSTFYAVTYTISDSSFLNRPFYVNFTSENTVIVTANGISQELPLNKNVEFTAGVTIQVQVSDKTYLTERLKSFDKNEYFFTINTPFSLVNQLYSGLDVRLMNSLAKTISVSYEGTNNILARDFVDAISHEFLAYDIERRSESSRKILGFLDEQLMRVYKELKSSETQIQEFKLDNKVTESERFSEVYLTRLDALEQQVVELEIQEKLIEQLISEINKDAKNIESIRILPLVTGTEIGSKIQAQLDELNELIRTRENLKYSVTSNSDFVKSIDYKINLQKNLIVDAISVIKQSVTEKKNDITSFFNETESKLYNVPAKELEFARLQRVFNINEKYYTLLLEKRTEYSISNAGFVSENVILEQANLPTAPISPNTLVIYITALLLGIVLSVVTIIVRYLLHDELTSLNEIHKITNVSVSTLGIIPKYNKKMPLSQLIVDKNQKSVIAEAFRTVRTNLDYINNSGGPKIMAITSTISGEGKTFVAINLGGIISLSGKKVILIDLDLRKPKVHLGFGVDNEIGMSSLLIQQAEIKDCIKHSSLENLDFITAGPIPPNPSELIINGQLDKVLEQLKETYDLIVIDNPPVGLVTDGIYCIKMSDYPLYVFRAEYSKKTFVQNVDRLINENKINNLSVILNGVDIERNSYGYNYGYGYGYGYTYTYGSNYYSDGVKKNKGFFKRFFNK